jgi:hypothetical protein
MLLHHCEGRHVILFYFLGNSIGKVLIATLVKLLNFMENIENVDFTFINEQQFFAHENTV